MYENEKTRLRRLDKNDVNTILAHWNNYQLRQYLPTPLPSNHEELVDFIESANDAYSKRKGFTFGIEDIDSGNLVGIVSLVNVSWISHNGEIGLLAILDPKDWRKGYGKDAMLVLLDVAFSVLNLHNVYLWVAGFNDRAIVFYEKIGFSKRGALRELAYRNGKRYDVVVMDILRSEFIEKYGILPKRGGS